MEREVRIRRRADAAAAGPLRPVMLRQCPHCGGDVRLVRDIYGAYRQCLQCSREIAPETLVVTPAPAPAMPAGQPERRAGRREVAERAVA